MSFFSITFSSDSTQEALLPALTQQLEAMTGTRSSTLAMAGAPPSLSELEAMTGTPGSILAMAGAPPSLSELEAMTGTPGSTVGLEGTGPTPLTEPEIMTEKSGSKKGST